MCGQPRLVKAGIGDSVAVYEVEALEKHIRNYFRVILPKNLGVLVNVQQTPSQSIALQFVPIDARFAEGAKTVEGAP